MSNVFGAGNSFGKFRILRLLGKGGMADVYEAIDVEVNRKVALKVLPLAFARDEERARRFAKEIQACAQLDHPNIVSVFDVGKVDHFHYYSMSVLPGGDLKNRLKNDALAPKLALRITRQIASALHYAHDKGLVHRDVKSENILFGEDGRAVLTDFGIVRATTSGTRMTETGLSIGTPHYMSPEQARGQEVDGRSDLYALGIVMYEMLSGQVPYDAADSLAIGIMHIQDSIPSLRPALSKFQPLIDGLLAKRPDNRYQTGQELIDDLERLEQDEKPKRRRASTRVVKRVPGKNSPKRPDHGSKKRDRGPPSSGGSRLGLYWGLGGAALAGVLATGIYLWQDHSGSMQPDGGGTTSVPRPGPLPIDIKDAESVILEPRALKPIPLPTGTAILKITTVPEGAEVFLNDQRLGETPFQSETLPEGEHRLRLVHRYYEPWEQTLRLENDVGDRIEAELQRGSGRITVITDPPGAEVWIDGQPAEGTTPLTLSGLQSGYRALEIRLTRYRAETHGVEVLPGETTQLNLQLKGGDLHEWDGRWLTGDEVVPLLLDAAEADLAAGRLVQPEGDNAWEKFQRVLVIRPDQRQATAGIQGIAEHYLQLAESALDNNQLDRAGNLLANAQSAGAEGSRYERANNRLQQAREQQRAEQHRRQLITDIQRELARLDREIRPDGNLGDRTVEAIRAFERATNRSERGEATEQLLAQLRATERWPASRPGEIFQDCPECPEMVVIPTGHFTMGSPSSEAQRRDTEGPWYEVHVAKFAMSNRMITVDEFRRFVDSTGHRTDAERATGQETGCQTLEARTHLPGDAWMRREGRSWRNPGMAQDDDHPVLCISWNDAQQYVRWMSTLTGENYRLPTESEWEYAARAGSATRFNTGRCIETTDANFRGKNPARGCSSGQFRKITTSVQSFSPNAWGLHDMHGNAFEWTQDCWNEKYIGAPANGSAWMKGDCSRAVLRGGSWYSNGEFLRSAARTSSLRDFPSSQIGFRIAKDLTP